MGELTTELLNKVLGKEGDADATAEEYWQSRHPPFVPAAQKQLQNRLKSALDRLRDARKRQLVAAGYTGKRP